MLQSARAFKGYSVRAQDGEIGSVTDFFLESREWTIRFFVCDTTSSFGRKVLIPPQALESKPDHDNRALNICASRETIKNSPQVDAVKPVSRSHQHILDRYYSWHICSPQLSEPLFEPPFIDSSAHSATGMNGYRLKTREGELASIDDFIIDDEAWNIDYIVMRTGLWLPNKLFLLDPRWLDEVSWPEKRVFADISPEKIRTSPDYDPSAPLNQDIQRSLYEHFGPPRYSTKNALEDIIRRKAQELYSKRGAAPGDDWADWFEAERLVKEELNRMIRKKVQELCSRRGCKPGNEWHDWFEAERIVKEEIRKKKE